MINYLLVLYVYTNGVSLETVNQPYQSLAACQTAGEVYKRADLGGSNKYVCIPVEVN